jgi:hypothetical protein
MSVSGSEDAQAEHDDPKLSEKPRLNLRVPFAGIGRAADSLPRLSEAQQCQLGVAVSYALSRVSLERARFTARWSPSPEILVDLTAQPSQQPGVGLLIPE